MKTMLSCIGIAVCTVVVLLLSLAAPSTRADEQDSFYFDPSPVDQDVIEGEEVRLRCDVSNRRMISFYWTLNGKQVATTTRRFQVDSDLRILKVDRVHDNGSFRCVATNVSTGMALRSTEAKLNIFWIDQKAEIVQTKSVRESSVLNVTKGSEVVMKCQAEGNPEPAIEWFHNEMRVSRSNRIRFHKNWLKIIPVYQSDTGVYTCKAHNTAGYRESINRILLVLQGAPDELRLNTDSFIPYFLTKRGNNAQLNCQYFNSISTEWYFNDTRLNNVTGKHVLMEGGGLIIRQVGENDGGAYKCVGLGDSGSQQAYTALVVLAYLNDLDQYTFEPSQLPNPLVIPAGGKLDVDCLPPKALPPPSLRWVKQNSKFNNLIATADSNNDMSNNEQSTNNDQLTTTGGHLSIWNADKSLTGSYSCVVENLAGSKNKTLDIVISVPPVIAKSPMSVRVEEEGTAMFECKVNGTPYPITTITWLFNDEPMDIRDKEGEHDEVHGIFRLNRVLLKDEGYYACVANTTGHPKVISNNAHLYVEKKLKFRPPPANARLELGVEGKVVCRADGKIPPKIRWTRSNSTSAGSALSASADQAMEKDGVLFFKKVERSDAGSYTCIASSEQGVINATIAVEVYVKPHFKVQPSNITAMEGKQQLMLHCVATGDPLPVIRWDKNNAVLETMETMETSRFKVLHNGTLVISEVYMEDYGKYSCTAENIGGSERVEVYIQVATAENYHKMMAGDKIEDQSMMRTIVIAVSCGLVYLAIVVGLTVYCTIKVTKAKNLKKSGKTDEDSPAGENALSENAGLVPRKELEVSSSLSTSSYNTRANMDDYNTVATLRGTSHLNLLSSTLHQTILPHRNPERLYLPRHKLQMLGMLGRSHYGDVFLARTEFGGGSSLVLVKSFLSKTEMNAEQCLREIDMLGRCNHKNVAKLFGLCADLDPLFVVIEHFEWGDLKKCLQASRDGLVPRMTTGQLVAICGQVALGMEHISNNNMVHRDLAARNVIICPSSMEVKISCPILCKDVYAQDYFILNDRVIPLRWMAPEAILDACETRESDVWSYGVFVWEVFSMGETPLSFKSNEKVLEGLNSRENKLPHPSLSPVATNCCDTLSYSDCPENMWRIIQACTVENPRSRPRFSDLVSNIYDLTYETVITKEDCFSTS